MFCVAFLDWGQFTDEAQFETGTDERNVITHYNTLQKTQQFGNLHEIKWSNQNLGTWLGNLNFGVFYS